ncbi:MAG: chromate transporter [Clostridiales bacterium]|nr:chromate transporter [Clostridiales bacterium]
MILLQLFFEFFKIGLFAIGGGLVTIPFLYDLASKTGWFSPNVLVDMIAIGESTPGPIGVNMATYVGYYTNGIIGGIIATLGLILPSLVIIIIISRMLEKVKNNSTIKNLFYGIRPVALALILTAALDIIFSNILNFTNDIITIIKSIIVFVVLLIGIRKIKIHPVWFIVISAVIGIICF